MGNDYLRQEHQSLVGLIEERMEEAPQTFIQNKLFEALESGRDVCNELRIMGHLRKAREELHGFSPDEFAVCRCINLIEGV